MSPSKKDFLRYNGEPALKWRGANHRSFLTRRTIRNSFAKLRETLETYFPGRQVYLIFGASEDKNIPGMFAEMKPKIKKLIATRADHPRALEPEKIIQLADQAGLEFEAVSPVESAFRRALELSAKDGSIVLSAGSMFVTAEVMKAWNEINR
ncbi:MAG: hypothetical protein QM730_13865 [Anaerolineales bacterium]